MDILGLIEMASELHDANEDHFIIVDAHNAGGSSRWQPSFPSLDDAQLARLGDAFAIRFGHSVSADPHGRMLAAQEAFNRICRDIADENCSMLSGTITYVGADWERIRHDYPGTRTLEFDISDDSSRPVLERDRLSFVDIAERL